MVGMAHYLTCGRVTSFALCSIFIQKVILVHMSLCVIILSERLAYSFRNLTTWNAIREKIQERRGFLDGDPKAVKAEDGALQGEVPEENICC